MIRRQIFNDSVWIDVERPSASEVKALIREFGISELIAEELRSPTIRPKAEYFRDQIYLVLHYPKIRQKKTGRTQLEIDFVVGEDFLITAHYEPIPEIQEFQKVAEVSGLIGHGQKIGHSGAVLLSLLGHLYKSLINELEFISSSIEEIENGIFNGKEREMVFALSSASKKLLDMKKAISMHKDILISLEAPGENILGKDFGLRLKTVYGEYYKAATIIESGLDFINELRETNNSLLTTKQNEIMQILTIMTFVALPLSLILAIFQIDTVSRPIVGGRGDFWLLLLLILVIAMTLLFFFKKKKWL
ncbi:MAG: hypothetical protein A3G59_02030 [Candidatus Taylorbacteria bacterium RIFCSPLOWO2_12_FULL_47_20]|uniref:Mg2 transporter protein CorA family protein n=2 Tax=Candidatus Tayloriibacteriota TaxID=1817919 RepID=A0A1G2P8T1_9BACT|nr:MAG: hypothetical protein A3H68_02600 [Candidatus Taylorbacteria bacterium RIFCSPLOWO2_02_FULL_46_40]OHA44119.1 MAG: hypothetical protein A3G59_02030 [Candidatus Taylorbacteria bacterium RIFCSPLOWO2_12_FULL_47_20]